MKSEFWREFFSGSNVRVNTWTVVGIVIAAPFAGLAFVALIYHIFILGKGLDSPSVQLLIATLGVSGGGLGASLFSRTTMMSPPFTGPVMRQEGPQRTIRKAPD